MTEEQPGAQLDESHILVRLVAILRDMTEDWDMEFNGPIGLETEIVTDLQFESIDVVQLVVAVEHHFNRRGLPWEELLMVDGRYVDQVKVKDAVAFLHRCLNGSGSAA